MKTTIGAVMRALAATAECGKVPAGAGITKAANSAGVTGSNVRPGRKTAIGIASVKDGRAAVTPTGAKVSTEWDPDMAAAIGIAGTGIREWVEAGTRVGGTRACPGNTQTAVPGPSSGQTSALKKKTTIGISETLQKVHPLCHRVE